MRRLVIGIAVVVGLVTVAGSVPIVEVPYSVEHQEPETYYQYIPLQYRNLDSFSRFIEPEMAAYAPLSPLGDLEAWATAYGYVIVLSGDHAPIRDYWALYCVIQNLDESPGTFEISYTLATADKEAAERQKNLIQRTPAEYEELDREYYAGSIELYLEPSHIGVFICPPGGIHIAPDRVPFGHEHEIVPDTREVESERPVTRSETHYKRVTIFRYLTSGL